MKILIILPRFHTNYIGVIRALKNQGFKVMLLVYNIGFTENYTVIKPVFIKENILTKLINSFFNIKLNKYYLPNFKIFQKKILKFSPDLIIVRPYNKLFSLYLIYLKFINKIELIFYNQSNEKKLDKFNFSLKFFQFFLINKILKIKIYSPIISQVKKLYFKNLYFLPFVSKISFREKNKKKKKHFLMIGKFVKKKNHEMFINSIENLILNLNLNIKATIIGEATTIEQKKEFYRIKNLIKKKNLYRTIKILKNINHKNIHKYYKKNDFFVLPTSGDLAPISIVEALGYGCIVLCSSSCGTKNYIKKGYNGYIFEDNNQKSFDKFMKKLVIEKKKYNQTIKRNKHLISSLISEKIFIKYFKNMLVK